MVVLRPVIGEVRRSFLPWSDFSTDPEALVRGHATWALGRIKGNISISALQQAYAVEQDPLVRSEIKTALGQ